MNTKIAFHFILADNDVDGDNEAFTNGALEEICKLCIGHYGIFDGTTCQAKITDAVVIASCGTTKDGRHKKLIYASAELPNNEEGRKLLDKIILEKLVASIACSVLNRDKVADDVTMISNVTNFYKFSLRFDEGKETMDKKDLERRLEAAEKQNLGLIDEIKYLKAQLAKVQDEPEIPDFPEFARNETYWCAGLDLKHVDSGCAAGGTIYGDYNCFHTKEMAQEFAKKCKLIAMLLHCKWYVDREYVPDWADEDEEKWQVFWSNKHKRYEACDWESDEYGSVFFSTEEKAMKCAKWLNAHWEDDDNEV